MTDTSDPPIVDTLADDILFGAEEIGRFIYGSSGMRRKVYNLTEKSRLPHFKLGGITCGSKASIRAFFARQEADVLKRGAGK